ncbi:MAG: hypothetical protein Q7S36_03775 [Candidatus Liptonbacteria bacterium]|nr:hypothetical protein [Candidatus Liptonbacteria bacterium]
MANQQLNDYVAGQKLAGVTEENIKKTLKEVGWPDVEIEASMRSGKPMAATAFPSGGNEPVKAENRVEPKKETMNFEAMINPSQMTSFPGSQANFKAKGADMNQKTAGVYAAAPVSARKKSILPWILVIIFMLALAGGGVFFYLKTNSLSGEVSALTASNTSLSEELSKLKNSGTSATDELNIELTALKADATEANMELSLFVVPQAASETPAVASGTPATASGTVAQATEFTLKGLIGFSKSQYTLTTAKGITLFVKNSKDPKLDAVLKPLVGATAELKGTHMPGSFDITAVAVNGTPF